MLEKSVFNISEVHLNVINENFRVTYLDDNYLTGSTIWLTSFEISGAHQLNGLSLSIKIAEPIEKWLSKMESSSIEKIIIVIELTTAVINLIAAIVKILFDLKWVASVLNVFFYLSNSKLVFALMMWQLFWLILFTWLAWKWNLTLF